MPVQVRAVELMLELADRISSNEESCLLSDHNEIPFPVRGWHPRPCRNTIRDRGTARH